jgi:hypothetical protein
VLLFLASAMDAPYINEHGGEVVIAMAVWLFAVIAALAHALAIFRHRNEPKQ